MKKLLSLLIILFSIHAKSQIITSVTPNQGTAGTTLSATITGSNTFFITASSQQSLGMSINLPGRCLTIYGTNIIIFTQDSAKVDFVIPSGVLNGNYQLYILTSNYNINLPAAITITGGVDYDVQSISPSVATENSTFSATITGVNLQSLVNLGGFGMYLSRNFNRIYPATNIQVVNANTITADFLFTPYCDTGNLSLFIQGNISSCFYLTDVVYVQGANPKKLLSINPSQATAGNTLTATVTGQNTFFMSASPQGFQMIQLRDQNCHVINGINPQITDEDHFTVDFPIPSNARNGVYELYINLRVNYAYVLPASFTITGGQNIDILSFSPASANAGTTVNVTITGIQVDSILSLGPVSITMIGSGGYNLHPTNIVSSPTQATMDVVVPIYADNGFYTLNITSAKGCYTISNALEVQGASPRELVSITPSTGVRGQTLSALITSSYTFFMTGTPHGGVQRVEFRSVNNNSVFNVFPPNITVNDSDHLTINFTIPFNVVQGFYDVKVVTYGGTSYNLHPGFEITGTRIAGNVYLDVDSNGTFNSGDVYLNGRKVLLLPDSVISITDNAGQFNFAVDSGQYTIQSYPDTEWVVTSSPPDYTFVIDSLDMLGLMFGLQPIHDKYELLITEVGGFPRCNRDVYYSLTYSNFSTTIASGVVSFVRDSNLIVTSATPAPDSTIGNTLYWNYDSLAVTASSVINMMVHLPAGGINLQSFAFVNAMDGSGNVLASASDTLSQFTVCSYDPNDKSVEPEGVDPEHYTLNGNYLEYLVRFQNTGTDTAFQVMILDTLDSDLNPMSLEVLASSHSVETHIFNNVVEFRFNNILLPDSNVDEPGSQGYIKFRILPRNLSATNIVIHNNANIYFDLNSPVITNTVFNTLVDQLPNGIEIVSRQEGDLLIYPNPSSSKINMLFKNPTSLNVVAKIYSANGSEVKSINAKGEMIEVDLYQWKQGFYFVTIESTDGKIRLRGKILVD